MKICPVNVNSFAKRPEFSSLFDGGGGKPVFCEFIRIVA